MRPTAPALIALASLLCACPGSAPEPLDDPGYGLQMNWAGRVGDYAYGLGSFVTSDARAVPGDAIIAVHVQQVLREQKPVTPQSAERGQTVNVRVGQLGTGAAAVWGVGVVGQALLTLTTQPPHAPGPATLRLIDVSSPLSPVVGKAVEVPDSTQAWPHLVLEPRPGRFLIFLLGTSLVIEAEVQDGAPRVLHTHPGLLCEAAAVGNGRLVCINGAQAGTPGEQIRAFSYSETEGIGARLAAFDADIRLPGCAIVHPDGTVRVADTLKGQSIKSGVVTLTLDASGGLASATRRETDSFTTCLDALDAQRLLVRTDTGHLVIDAASGDTLAEAPDDKPLSWLSPLAPDAAGEFVGLHEGNLSLGRLDAKGLPQRVGSVGRGYNLLGGPALFVY